MITKMNMDKMNKNHGNPKILQIPVQSKEQQDKITHKIIGFAMEVYNTLGNGFQEVFYQRSLSIELMRRALSANEKWKCQYFIKDRM